MQRRRQLLGFPEDDAATVGKYAALFATSAQVCMKEEFDICRDAHIVARTMPAHLRIERQLALLGLPDQPLDEADAYVDKCLRFELQMASTVDSRETDPYSTNQHSMSEAVDSRVSIGYRGWVDNHLLVMETPAPLVSRSYTVTSNDPCNSISNAQRVGGQLSVFLLNWTTRDGPSSVEPAQVAAFWLTLAPTQPNTSHYTPTQRIHTRAASRPSHSSRRSSRRTRAPIRTRRGCLLPKAARPV